MPHHSPRVVFDQLPLFIEDISDSPDERCPPPTCADCAVTVEDEYYVVHDPVWAAAGMKPDGGDLCVGCLEQRLGRMLTPADFTDAAVNADPDWEWVSERLRERLQGGSRRHEAARPRD